MGRLLITFDGLAQDVRFALVDIQLSPVDRHFRLISRTRVDAGDDRFVADISVLVLVVGLRYCHGCFRHGCSIVGGARPCGCLKLGGCCLPSDGTRRRRYGCRGVRTMRNCPQAAPRATARQTQPTAGHTHRDMPTYNTRIWKI